MKDLMVLLGCLIAIIGSIGMVATTLIALFGSGLVMVWIGCFAAAIAGRVICDAFD